jgi:hypothetical protein
LDPPMVVRIHPWEFCWAARISIASLTAMCHSRAAHFVTVGVPKEKPPTVSAATSQLRKQSESVVPWGLKIF